MCINLVLMLGLGSPSLNNPFLPTISVCGRVTFLVDVQTCELV